MSLASDKYREWQDSILPFNQKYARFWYDLLASYGFTMEVSSGPYHYYHCRCTANGVKYVVKMGPTSYQGIWFVGDGFRKKLQSENGLRKFLKDQKIGIFAV